MGVRRERMTERNCLCWLGVREFFFFCIVFFLRKDYDTSLGLLGLCCIIAGLFSCALCVGWWAT